jgi:hypothetical protein
MKWVEVIMFVAVVLVIVGVIMFWRQPIPMAAPRL